MLLTPRLMLRRRAAITLYYASPSLSFYDELSLSRRHDYDAIRLARKPASYARRLLQNETR